MKKILAILVLLSLILLCSCENKTVSIAELEKKFDTEEGYIKKSETLAHFKRFNRDDMVDIVYCDDDYYYIDHNNTILAIEKKFIRKMDETDPSSYSAYTRNGAVVYEDGYFEKSIKSFGQNEVVKVIDYFGNIAFAEYADGEFGYFDLAYLSKNKIEYTPPTPKPPQSDDGEDISLVSFSDDIVITNPNAKETAKILADGTKAFIAVFSRGDVVEVLDKKTDSYDVVIGGHKASIPISYIRLKTDEAFEPFEVYTNYNAASYKEFSKKNRITSYSLNTLLTVIDELDNMYIISLENEDVAYIEKSYVSRNKITPYVPKPVTPEWTDPVL